MNSTMSPVELEKAYRLVNHGPTVLVSACHDGVEDVMAAAWCCGLDFAPPKLTVVLDKASKTRELLENSGYFAIQVPTTAQLELTNQLGSISLRDTPDKLARCQVALFRTRESDVPLVTGCAAWLLCKLIPEPHNQQTYDLFIGEVIGAWADSRVFSEGHWHFETADPKWRSLHHVAGGHYYAIGDAMDAKES
ncbi:flavin reductase domain protein FMN-binding [Dickeya chrysanthemi Ech1591]|uniref:Flavin reductase domain protein FMN-binding n=1 Tax=Dickeya chrysanthemi (strain Ech1591) TaxID=561229 RepID=C6CKR6_DICC1|nr:flavin reductase family protein [Dickeya chrysanthemi]ACT05568.1 flavin reductase domain protein FMN-binding [Dickeya chrysanthemi Ech1591]